MPGSRGSDPRRSSESLKTPKKTNVHGSHVDSVFIAPLFQTATDLPLQRCVQCESVGARSSAMHRIEWNLLDRDDKKG